MRDTTDEAEETETETWTKAQVVRGASLTALSTRQLLSLSLSSPFTPSSHDGQRAADGTVGSSWTRGTRSQSLTSRQARQQDDGQVKGYEGRTGKGEEKSTFKSGHERLGGDLLGQLGPASLLRGELEGDDAAAGAAAAAAGAGAGRADLNVSRAREKEMVRAFVPLPLHQ